MLNKLIKNKNLIIFISVFLFSLLLFSLFLQPHYIHDTYVVYGTNFDFSDRFIYQGRILTYLYFLIFGVSGLFTASTLQLISTVGSLVCMSFSVLLIYNLFEEKVIKTNKYFPKVLLLIVVFGIIFNIYVVSWMMFHDSIIMNLGVLLGVVAAKFFLVEKKLFLKYFISTLLFTISCFCYQSSFSLGMSLITLLLLYENRNSKVLIIIRKFIVSFIPCIIALLLNYLFVKFVNSTGFDYRVGTFDFFYNLNFIFNDFDRHFINSFNFFNFSYFLFISLIVLGIIVYYLFKGNRKKIIRYVVYIVVSTFMFWFLTIFPSLAMVSEHIYILPRSIVNIGGIINFMIVILILYNYNKIFKNKFFIILIVFNFILCTSIIVDIQSDNLRNSSLDISMGNIILEEIYNYEKENDVIIQNIVLVPSIDISITHEGINSYGETTMRSFSINYGVEALMMFLTDREFNIVQATDQQRKEYFSDYDESINYFKLDQLYFRNKTLYLYTY